MIATLTGLVTDKYDDKVVLEVNGIGYELSIAGEDQAQLTMGEIHKLFVYEHVRDNATDLFGFRQTDNKQLFETLLSVNGVGPKVALALLNLGDSTHVRSAIANGEVKFIQSASGVGKRVAERIVVDLKDKVGLPGTELAGAGLLQTDGILRQDEAIEALVTLGFSPQDASRALANIDKSLPTEERVRLALQNK